MREFAAGRSSDPYWREPVDSLLADLDSTSDGLSTPEAQARLVHFGPNALKPRGRATPLKLFLGQFRNPIVLILLFATGVSAVTQEWVDAVIILAIVLGSALLSFFQEYRASSAAEELRAWVQVRVTALWDRQPRAIPAEQGVLIPSSKVPNLMVKEEMVAAVQEGKSRVWPVRTIDEGIEILTGVPAGRRQEDGTFEEGTVNFPADQRLHEMAETICKFIGAEKASVTGG
jgi:hypothetical protein